MQFARWCVNLFVRDLHKEGKKFERCSEGGLAGGVWNVTNIFSVCECVCGCGLNMRKVYEKEGSA
jgi:hypothetical protein